MTYLHLLSPEGEPFEVIESRAGKLLADGWSFNPGPLKDAIARVDDDSATTLGLDPVAPQGAVADAEAHANDIPVDVVQEPTVAGPDAEVQEVNVVDGPASEPVSEDAGVRKARRGFVTSE